MEIGDIVIGKITAVKPYALFMSFEDGCTGLCHISELSDLYIRDIERFGTIGDELKVKILQIDRKNGFLRVSYKQVPENEKYSTHDEKSKVKNTQEKDFSPLKEKLDEWINNTLNEIKESDK